MCLLLLPSLIFAGDTIVSGFFEAGTRSQEEDFEEERDDREYTFRNYHTGLSHRVSEHMQYEVGTFLYDKDFRETDARDSVSRLFQGRGEYTFRTEGGASAEFRFNARYKEKRYRGSPSEEYDQTAFSPEFSYEERGSYKVKIGAGVNRYDYRSTAEKDQMKIFSKLSMRKYLLPGKNLTLVSSYRFETAVREKAGRKKDMNEVLGGLDWRVGIPSIQKISVRATVRQGDAKDDDERDDDYDYEYVTFSVKTLHKITSQSAAGFAYRYFRKEYEAAGRDHRGFLLSSDWGHEIVSDRTHTVDFHAYAEHKDVDYTLPGGDDYQKETLSIRGSYRGRQSWNASLHLTGSLYEFKDPTGDKNRYSAKAYIEKSFVDGTLAVSLNVKYTYTDNRHSNNTEEESARLGFQYSF